MRWRLGRSGCRSRSPSPLSAISVASRAQSNTPPCVLDKCVNGALTGPRSLRTDAPAAAAPGNFDFYVLTLSWSPGFCDTGGAAQVARAMRCRRRARLCRARPVAGQSRTGYPADCGPSRPISRHRAGAAHGVFPSAASRSTNGASTGPAPASAPRPISPACKRARDAVRRSLSFQSAARAASHAPIDVRTRLHRRQPGLDRRRRWRSTCAQRRIGGRALLPRQGFAQLRRLPEGRARAPAAPARSPSRPSIERPSRQRRSGRR